MMMTPLPPGAQPGTLYMDHDASLYRHEPRATSMCVRSPARRTGDSANFDLERYLPMR